MIVLAGGGFLGTLMIFIALGIILFLIRAIFWGIAYLIALEPKEKSASKNSSDNSSSNENHKNEIGSKKEKKSFIQTNVDRLIFLLKKKNPEVKELTRKINSLDNRLKIIKDTQLTLHESLNQNLITKEKLQTEENKLDNQLKDIRSEKSRILKRIAAIEDLNKEFQNLNILKEKGIINQTEYDSKKEELIQIKMHNS